MEKEILKLRGMLVKAGIPHSIEEHHLGYHLMYLKNENGCVCSAIQTSTSYGNKQNLIEIMGLLFPEEAKMDKVVGFLTAEQVFNRIQYHHTHKHWPPKSEVTL